MKLWGDLKEIIKIKINPGMREVEERTRGSMGQTRAFFSICNGFSLLLSVCFSPHPYTSSN